MDNNKKKLVAAISGVISYIRQEEDAAQIQSATSLQKAAPTLVSLNSWSISGRQDIMQMRQMTQMRAFQRLK
jgi:hypothetical protein